MEELQDLLKVTDVLNKNTISEEKKLDVFSPSCLVSLPVIDLEESGSHRVEKESNKIREDLNKIKSFKKGKNDVTDVPIKHNVPKNGQGIVEENKLGVFSPSCPVSLSGSNQEESFKKAKNYVTDVPITHTVTEKEQGKMVEKKLDVYPPSLLVSLSASKPDDVQIKHTDTETQQEKKLDVFSPSFLVSLPASNQEDSENKQAENSVKKVKIMVDSVQSKNKKREEVKLQDKLVHFKEGNNGDTDIHIQYIIAESNQEKK